LLSAPFQMPPIRWPEFLARMDPSSRVFTLALAGSLFFHALVLTLHFNFPDASRLKATTSTLDVILVNSKTQVKPTHAQVLAQANLDGGGNTDQDRRMSTPLPALQETRRGTDLKRASRRQQELEAQQQRLMTQLKSRARVASNEARRQPDAEPQPAVSGSDLAASALALARMQAQIQRNIEEYNKRPRKEFIGVRATEYRFAQYAENWRIKIERIGALNYPTEARGRVYGSLQLSVSINPDGTLAGIDIERSSGYPVLDRAAERIVKLGAPYAPFPPNIRKDRDILVITRTWTFAPGDKLFTE